MRARIWDFRRDALSESPTKYRDERRRPDTFQHKGFIAYKDDVSWGQVSFVEAMKEAAEGIVGIRIQSEGDELLDDLCFIPSIPGSPSDQLYDDSLQGRQIQSRLSAFNYQSFKALHIDLHQTRALTAKNLVQCQNIYGDGFSG